MQKYEIIIWYIFHYRLDFTKENQLEFVFYMPMGDGKPVIEKQGMKEGKSFTALFSLQLKMMRNVKRAEAIRLFYSDSDENTSTRP